MSRMQSTEVDLELETRVTDFYVEYWVLSLSMEGRAEWQREFCELGASSFTEERVVLHGDHLLRMKGEMVHEFKCEWVVVTSWTGYKAEGERCLDPLPVFTAQQEVSYLAPITRVLTPRSAVSLLNCSTNFPLTLEDKQGRMVTANPGVTLVEVALRKYHNREKGGHNHTELFDIKSLLYTADEVAEYEQMLLGPGGERAVTWQFSSYSTTVRPWENAPRPGALRTSSGSNSYRTPRTCSPGGGTTPRTGSCGGEQCCCAVSASSPWCKC